MDETIGVVSWFAGDITSELKKSLIFCDKIALHYAHTQAQHEMFSQTDAGKKTLRNVTFLMEKGVVIRAPELVLSPEEAPWLSAHDELLQHFNKVKGPDVLWFVKSVLEGEPYGTTEQGKILESDKSARGFMRKNLYCRLAALQLHHQQHVSSIPIIDSLSLPPGISTASQQDVLAIILALPLPTANTKWEAIFDYKNDVEARQKYLRLKKHVKKLGSTQLSVNEIQDAVNDSLNEYRTYMKVKHRHILMNKLQVILVNSTEILESLPQLKISKGIEIVMECSKYKAEVLEAEMNAPGREFAYIANAEKIGNRKWWQFWKR